MKFDQIIQEAEENLKLQGLKGFVQQYQFEKMDDDEIKLIETGHKKSITYPPNLYAPRESLIKVLGTPHSSKAPFPGQSLYYFFIKFKDGLAVTIRSFGNKRREELTDIDYISCSFAIDDKFTEEYIHKNMNSLVDRILSIIPNSRRQNL